MWQPEATSVDWDLIGTKNSTRRNTVGDASMEDGDSAANIFQSPVVAKLLAPVEVVDRPPRDDGCHQRHSVLIEIYTLPKCRLQKRLDFRNMVLVGIGLLQWWAPLQFLVDLDFCGARVHSLSFIHIWSCLASLSHCISCIESAQSFLGKWAMIPNLNNSVLMFWFVQSQNLLLQIPCVLHVKTY